MAIADLSHLTPARCTAEEIAASGDGRATPGDGSMKVYRFYFLGSDDKIKKSAELIECPTDAAALAEAEQKLVTSEYHAIEVWDRARCVGKVGHLKDRREATAHIEQRA
ncbi:MAG TPA: hypothetical protein VGF34_05225 [Stellaceae bacterium]|jgi:hypothetical protein